MQITRGRIYRASSGARLIFTAAKPSSGTVFYRDREGDFKVVVSKVTATSFHLFIPQLNMSGMATVEPNDCFIWRNWAYCLQPNPFTGELTLTQEDPHSKRIGSFLLVGKSDGHVVYISRDPQGHGSSYRAFIERVSPEGGTLRRVTITNTPVLSRGSLRMMTSLGSIDTGNGTWRDLTISGYEIVETPTEVRFKKKR